MNKTDLDNYINSKIYTNVTEDITGNRLQEVLRTINESVENNSNKGIADGYASLDGTGKVPLEQLPIQPPQWGDITGDLVDQTDLQDALDLKEDTANKGIANGYAPLNGSTKIDSTYLPSYVDDVVEVANYASLPVTGETGKIYVTIDTGYIYRWSGSIYVKIAEQIQSDYTQTNTSAVDYIKNKPTISVGLSMPSAFNVTGSPTSNGTLTVTGAGVASQYVRGDGQLATFPTTTGGGSSVSYYLNGGTSQGTIGGNAYYQMSRTATNSTGVDFTISSNGYIARFITDAGDPALLSVPSGNWNIEFFFSANSSGGSPSFYVDVYKYNGSTFTLLGTSSTAPEVITNGTTTDTYFTSVSIPTNTLLVTDRIALDIYVNHSGRTITLHTQDSHLCQVITTFSTGLNAINGLTNQVQYLSTGTSGTDFAINSTSDTHTFNLPVASSTKTGKLSSTDWSTFNDKQDFLVSGTNIQTINGNSILGSGNLQLATTKIRRHDTQLPYDYLGWAIDGTAESSTGWTITRLTITSAGTTTKGTATGAWSNRTSLTYI